MSVEVLKQVWPEWQIEEKPLGKGSFGVVYKAVRRENNIESFAAIKIISIPVDPSEIDSLQAEGLNADDTKTYLQGIMNDFVSEIQLMESLKGVQNIVSVEDYKVVEKIDEIGWNIYIRMELLTPFNTYIKDKKLTEAEVIKIGCDICTALEICGKRNVIHRDIKPENIFINDFGHFKLGDFGIARKMENMSGGLSQKGTFNYMAPEVATSNEYDSSVDTYSLGIVLYRLLNGNKLPFLDNEKQLLNPNERRNAVERRIRGEKLTPPCDASPEMADIILRACEYEPSNRFKSATEMKEALSSVAKGTYQIVNDKLDKTTSVRKAPNGDNGTVSVRKAPVSSNQKPVPVVNTFGSEPKKTKKAPIIFAIILVVLLLGGVGIFVLLDPFGDDETGVANNNSTEANSNSTSNNYFESDEEKIAAIINGAEGLAGGGDYEAALNKINEGLVKYPNSLKLKEKKEEYTSKLNASAKEKILSEAETLANAGDYVGAMKLIKDAQNTYGDDKDYQSAYEKYNQANNNIIKAEAIAKAEKLAQEGDNLSALETINNALVTVGEDSELTSKAEIYENAYVTNISSQVDKLLEENNINDAKELLLNAMNKVPNNDVLINRKAEIDMYKTVLLNTLNPINGSFNWNEGTPADPFGSDYTNLQNYVIFHKHFHDDKTKQTIEYKIDEQYDFLSFTISPYSDFDQYNNAYVQIYADGSLRYTSQYIVQKTQPYTINVDVSNATYIKVVVIVEDYYSCIMLSDITLSSVPNYSSSYNGEYTSLSILDTFNGSLSWNEGHPGNIWGDDYTKVNNYATLERHYYSDSSTYTVEYFLNKKYSSLNFNVAPLVDFGASGTSYVKVYLDDVLTYTSPAIKQKTVLFDIGNLDVSNASYLKIVIEISYEGCLIISDALLKNK